MYGHIRCIYTVLANPNHLLCLTVQARLLEVLKSSTKTAAPPSSYLNRLSQAYLARCSSQRSDFRKPQPERKQGESDLIQAYQYAALSNPYSL
jgi:hypothetical protein